MGIFSILREALSAAPTAASGETELLIDSTSGQLALKDDAGKTVLVGTAPGQLVEGGCASLTANTAAINTTETVVLNYQIPLAALQVGTTLRVTGFAQGSGTATGTGTVTIRIGTAGTTADNSMVASGTLALPTGATGVRFDGLVTCRSTGAAGTVSANIVTGVSGVIPLNTVNTTTATVNTTVANFIDVTVKTTATTSSLIVVDCDIVCDQA